MATTDAVLTRVLAKMREICLALPDTKETMTDDEAAVSQVGVKETIGERVALTRET